MRNVVLVKLHLSSKCDSTVNASQAIAVSCSIYQDRVPSILIPLFFSLIHSW
uniref:Uncharacterized protein n=1 Tax=Anguilla anguilla TaxID=7936 RepID=A0A0E9TF49_ANGAN